MGKDIIKYLCYCTYREDTLKELIEEYCYASKIFKFK